MLAAGGAVAWRFDPEEARLALTLPAVFGGATHAVRLSGGYAFEPLVAPLGAPLGTDVRAA